MQKVDDIRAISDEFCADGNAKSSSGLSNMVWGFGQFLGVEAPCSCTCLTLCVFSAAMAVNCSLVKSCADSLLCLASY